MTIAPPSRRADRSFPGTQPDYRRLVESLGGAMWQLDASTGRITYIGPQIESLLGYPVNHWYESDTWEAAILPEDRTMAIAFRRHITSDPTRRTMEYRMRRADGDTVWIRDEHLGPDDPSAPTIVTGYTCDITTDKLTQLEQTSRDKTLAVAQRVARLGSWSLDVASSSIRLSPEAARLLGLDGMAETTLDAFVRAVPTDDRFRVNAALHEAIALASPFSVITRVAAMSETSRSVRILAETATLDDGSTGLAGTIQDITEQAQVESAMSALARVGTTQDVDRFLRECTRSLAQHYHTKYAFIGLLLPDGQRVQTQAVWAGDDFADNFEYELAGTPCQNVLDHSKELTPRDASRIYPDDQMLVDMGIESYFGAPMIGADGKTIGLLAVMDTAPLELDLWTAPVLGLYAARIAVEIQRKQEAQRAREKESQLQEQLAHARRLESVGRLAGGVAHDFNNMLTVIFGCGGLLTAKLGEHDEDLAEILEAAHRAKALTAQLLSFSRRQPIEARPMAINDVVTNMTPLLTRLLGERHRLDITLARDVDLIEADPLQIEQVLMNLVVNARDAMPNGGAIEISTRAIPRSLPRQGPFVELAVTDSGVGMDEQTRAQIFDPFFTTKARGKGTGLGLATSYGIAQQLGGEIRVDSQLGQGSRFHLRLPCVERSKAAPTSPGPRSLHNETRAPDGDAQSSRRILLVEDEAPVRAVTQRILSRRGYDVVAVESGETAVEALRDAAGEVSLAIVDIVLRDMSGQDAVAALRAIDPSLRVLFMSGYSERAIPSGPQTRFIGKPFSAQELTTRVRQCLADGE